MNPEKLIKRQAKEALRGNLPAAVGAVITVMISFMTVLFLSSTLSSVVSLLMQNAQGETTTESSLIFISVYFTLLVTGFVFTLPLIMGFVRLSYLIAKNSYCDYSQVFYYLCKGRFFSSMFFYLRLIFKNLWQAVISFAPALLCLLRTNAVSQTKEQLAINDIIWYYITYILLFAGIILFSYLSENSFLAIYYYIENKSNYTNQIFAFSEINMIPLGKSYVKLNTSLLPYMLMCILVIPCIFAIPLITTAQATSAKWIIALSDKDEV